MEPAEILVDLHDRLVSAGESLHGLVSHAWADDNFPEYHRLLGKYEGVALALDYLRGYESGDAGASSVPTAQAGQGGEVR